MTILEYQALRAALLWHIDAGADMPLEGAPQTLFGLPALPEAPLSEPPEPDRNINMTKKKGVVADGRDSPAPLGASEAKIAAVKLAMAVQSLDDLQRAIAGFDGLSLKTTATNMVFSDGWLGAPIMVIGDAPGADEDRVGKPFVGVGGQLFDRIMGSIGLDRTAQDPAHALYISNVLNWRPPGNRTPNMAEIEVSLPFIERHIQLVQPKLLLFVGGVAAQALLGSKESISRLRGRWHDYVPQTPALRVGADGTALGSIPALATYHPSYLLQTPAQKRQVWADMLAVLEKRKDLGLIQ